ncbi:class I SAM-dependent methyltransferase [Ovoidimarina sediminis]|uniref:class I SAM-dependent methyltransferase n=1 Tax=Ovoidimarina sediminis TaxID=3079856 RepID=UPI002931F26F|nr:class I SAM-dependent methyltransferase [Rhodophyticola sp. MJ-SS7]
MRKVYVLGMRSVRAVLRAVGLLNFLEDSKNVRITWIRSLFAIYDFEDMKIIGLPWWTFSGINAVEKFLGQEKSKRVFEWGSGVSTIWLSERSKYVVSVEFDTQWFERISKEIKEKNNIDYRMVQAEAHGNVESNKRGFSDKYFDAYVGAISREPEPFDLIVIDGRARERCLEAAIPHLKAGGIILFDDTSRQRYIEAISNSGLPAKRFNGLAVSLPYPGSTTLIAREEEVLNGLMK